MADSTQTADAEYKMIRSEIDQKITLHNTLLTFTITTTVAILAIAAGDENTNAFLFLLPFCVIIPMSNRIAYYRKAMAKLSSYLIVFCESQSGSINWETRNLEFFKLTNDKAKGKSFVLNYYECMILGLICYVLFLYNYILETDLDTLSILNCLWPLVLVIWETCITLKINRIDKDRLNLIKTWEAVKSANKVTYTEYIQDRVSISHSPKMIFTNDKGIGLYLTDREAGAGKIQKTGNSLDIFLVQALAVFLYLGGQNIANIIFPGNSTLVSLASLCLYIILLITTAVFTKIVVVPRKYGFKEESYPAIFQIHLFCIFIFFLIWKDYYSAILILTLFFGFAVSQADVIKYKTLSEMCSHFLEPYVEAKMSLPDFFLLFFMDCSILSISFLTPRNELFIICIILSLLGILLILSWIRTLLAKTFCTKAIGLISEKSKCMVWNIGHDNVVCRELQKALEFSIDMKTTCKGEHVEHSYGTIIVVNTLSSKENCLSKLDELETLIMPNGFVIDPSISRLTKRRSKLYVWFGIPNPFPQKYNLKQYKYIIRN